jgi:hypothetical protein
MNGSLKGKPEGTAETHLLHVFRVASILLPRRED